MSLASTSDQEFNPDSGRTPRASRSAFRGVRRASIIAAAACSLAAGWGALYIAVTPDTIGVVSTPVLLGSLGLFALPLVLLVLVRIDRVSRRTGRLAHPTSESPREPAQPLPASHASGRDAGLASRAHRARVSQRSSVSPRA
ncbi:MAG: hypothetical protein RBS39_08245 [Phycisphaerales bacterium]|nr:hypothetical protein [Phycisphaerales bacterium]